MTQPSNVYWLDNHWVSERTLADKKKWAKEQGSLEWISIFDSLKKRKLKGKFKYVQLLGDRKTRKETAVLFNYKPLPYPKRA